MQNTIVILLLLMALNFLFLHQLTDDVLCVQAGPAVRVPPGLPAAQPAAAVPARPLSSARLPLPGLQLRLQPLRPPRAGAVPLRRLTLALRRVPQLQLLPRHVGAHSHRVPEPSDRHASFPGCTQRHVCPPAGLPALPPAPAQPHAVSDPQLQD